MSDHYISLVSEKLSSANSKKTAEKIVQFLIEQKIIEKKDSYVVISPLIKLLSKKIKFDLKIKVICNINDQIKRVESRDGLEKNTIKKIIAYQESNYELIEPDFIFDSAGDLEEQLIKLKNIL